MKTLAEYVELLPHAKTNFCSDKIWRDEAYRSWRCQCAQPKPGVHGPIDVVVQNPKRKMAVDSVSGFSGIEVVAVSIIKKLGKDRVYSLFDVGAVLDNQGRKVGRYVTLMAKHGFVYVRGGPRSLRRVCPECGRLLYLAVDDAYLCGLDRKEAILQCAFGHLLIRRDVFDATLKKTKLPHVKLRRLQIRDSTSDGLPVSIDAVVRLLKRVKSQVFPEVARQL